MRQDKATRKAILHELELLAKAATSATGKEWRTDYDYAPIYGGWLLWLYPAEKCRKAEGIRPGLEYQLDCLGRMSPKEAQAAIIALAGWIKRGHGING